ncbi:conserved membrane hypothetical protein [uncultured Pleomorphomonas sp.]|uniref:Uncharacterized protein n=1 Tax=uncultured Pleomorphomonas sp. TaxID=442121 RepID=A0A212LEV3_9HYPH|nr:conserved membrane hypothetical protein [uncultured Pleomorphomonas sp.]
MATYAQAIIVPHIIGMPPHIIIMGMPPCIMAIMRLQQSMNMSMLASSIGIISHVMPVLVILQVILAIMTGIICGIMPPIIGFIMPPIIGMPIIGIMPFIIGIIWGIMLPIIGICIMGIIGCMFMAVFISLSPVGRG